MTETTDWAAQTETRLLDAALPHVREFGWTSRLIARAAQGAGLTLPEAELLLPEGPRDLATLLSYRHDEAAISALGAMDPTVLKMRERIARGVEARVEAAMVDDIAVRRLLGFLSLPPNIALGARLAWASADRIWRWAGDTASDENHYSKRAILAALLGSTLAVRLSGGPAAAELHLARGIEAVMAYERAKAGFLRGRDIPATVAEALGRMRYGRTQAKADATHA